MKNIEIGMEVKAKDSRSVGIIIDSTTYTGTVVKVNQKSFIVEFNHILVKRGQKVVRDAEYSKTVKYSYWKVGSDGRTIYKSDLCGIIRL